MLDSIGTINHCTGSVEQRFAVLKAPTSVDPGRDGVHLNPDEELKLQRSPPVEAADR